MRGGDLGEAHHEHGPDREVGDDEAVGRTLAPLRGQLGQAGGVEARRTHHRVGTETPPHCEVAHDDVGPSELHDHVGSSDDLGIISDRETGDPIAGGPRVETCDQVQVRGVGDRLAHQAAHAPCCAGDRDSDHLT